jgi:hypothetical protein
MLTCGRRACHGQSPAGRRTSATAAASVRVHKHSKYVPTFATSSCTYTAFVRVHVCISSVHLVYPCTASIYLCSHTRLIREHEASGFTVHVVLSLLLHMYIQYSRVHGCTLFHDAWFERRRAQHNAVVPSFVESCSPSFEPPIHPRASACALASERGQGSGGSTRCCRLNVAHAIMYKAAVTIGQGRGHLRIMSHSESVPRQARTDPARACRCRGSRGRCRTGPVRQMVGAELVADGRG